MSSGRLSSGDFFGRLSRSREKEEKGKASLGFSGIQAKGTSKLKK